MVKYIPAFHSIEYIYCIVINDVVKDFKGVALTVKTNKEVFIFVLPFAFIKPTIIFSSVKSPANIRFAHIVFECGWVEFNDYIH